MQAALIYPHQLYSEHPAIRDSDVSVLVEDPLFFSQYRFHRQKLVLHRAALTEYARSLTAQGRRVEYVEAGQMTDSGTVAEHLTHLSIRRVRFVELCDDWLESRVSNSLTAAGIGYEVLPDPNFLTPLHVFDDMARAKSKWFFTDFYTSQRKRLKILVDSSGKPVGGKWSFDPENRRKLPKDTVIPKIDWPQTSKPVQAAVEYVRKNFPNAIGSDQMFRYPIDRSQAVQVLDDFIEQRLTMFGDYEDAIRRDDDVLFHSVLTPCLNIGLISPNEIVQAVLKRSEQVPLNSLEGFLRQVIGWREYMRGVYHQFGRQQRCRNFWQHQHAMPAAFYDGTTGVDPVDNVILKVLQSGYCHHIERLMILGNFMLLCELHPHHVYQWFMELFIDAYDWVMVPNVYGMSQFADGGRITTKPYISGSNYIRKMSDYPAGDWCAIWDALYWRFIHKHRSFFATNPRMSVMVTQCDRMGDKLSRHLKVAERYLTDLHQK